jgi:hypothetical protein
MRQYYSDEEIAEIMSPIEEPLQMQKIIEVKRGPISRFLTSVVSGFGVLSYVRIFGINLSSSSFSDSSDRINSWSHLRRVLRLQKSDGKTKTTKCGSNFRF